MRRKRKWLAPGRESGASQLGGALTVTGYSAFEIEKLTIRPKALAAEGS